MRLGEAHEGYEYQDLLTSYFVLYWVLEDKETTFHIDKKEFESDVFDDLTIRNEIGIFKKQIKYSNIESNHFLEKGNISASSSYNLSLDELFNSWNNHPQKNDLKVSLCLAWNEPKDELLDVLTIINRQGTFKDFTTTQYYIEVEKLWPTDQDPITKWRRFREKSKKIDRNSFIEFCEAFIIEVNFPKFSLDIYSPGPLEKIVLDQVERIGIGFFPNNKISKEEFVLALCSLIKKARSKGSKITTKQIFGHFSLVTNYGSIEQNFPIDESKNIDIKDKFSTFIELIRINKKILLVGEPGSGKSWFINNLMAELNTNDINCVKHYCYTDLQDDHQKERIRKDVFYGNLINEIVELYPELKQKKRSIYASTLSELNLLVRNISQRTVLIVDGLDHIKRIYNYRPYDMRLEEMSIIKELNNIEVSQYLSIVVASQEVQELDGLQGYTLSRIPKWDITNTQRLMRKFRLDDIRIEEVLLSNILLEKSNGNPLYLTYLIKELRTRTSIDKKTLNLLPSYSYNLEDYYDYLLSKLKKTLNNDVPFALSAVNFSLTKQELEEITGLGDYVDESLDTLKPILRQNTTSSGYIIYHESFRRFILNFLESKKIIEKKIFQPVIDWFDRLDFYNSPKAYRYYLQILIDGRYYEKVLDFITVNFITNCVYSGHPWRIIKNNFKYLAIASTKSQNVEKVIICNEISKLLTGVEDSYEEYFLYYIEAFGHKNGFEEVARLLVFDNQATIDKKLGLDVCQLLEKKNVVAPWDYYLDAFKEGESVEYEYDDFGLHVRTLIDRNCEEILLGIADKISSGELSHLEADFKEELSSWPLNTIAKEVLKKMDSNTEHLIDIKQLNLIQLTKDIVKLERTYEFDPHVFFTQVEKQIHDKETIAHVITLLSNISWFYNWLIYVIKVKQLEAKEHADSTELKATFEFLIKDTERSKGNIRTHDLYTLREVIYDSFGNGLRLIKRKKDWGIILNILNQVCTETTSTYRNEPSGPLPPSSFFKLLLDHINENNSDLVIKELVEQYELNKDIRLYIHLAEYCFQLVKVFSYIGNNERVESFYEQGIKYMLGYSWHKDITIEDVLESIVSLNSVNSIKAKEYILKLKDLTDAVAQHTDGKETQYFPIDWFEKFYDVDPIRATAYLLNESLQCSYSWILEHSLAYLITSDKPKVEIVTKCFLNQTMVTRTHHLFLSDSFRLYRSLRSETMKKVFAATINSRVLIEKNSEYTKQFQEELLRQPEELQLPLSRSKYHNRRQRRRSLGEHYIDNVTKKCINRKQFSEMTLIELSDYINKTTNLEGELQSLDYVFNNYKCLTPTVKDLVLALVTKADSIDSTKKIDITPIFNEENDLSVYFWIVTYVYNKGENLESLSNIDAFKRGYSIDPQKSLEFLFELLAEELDLRYRRMFSANLLNAFSTTTHETEPLVDAWLSMYNFIEHRLPSRDIFDWEAGLNNELNLNLEEMHICLLITRMQSRIVHRCHIVLSGLSVILHNDSTKVINPLKWFFRNSKHFTKPTISVILQLLLLFEETEEDYLMNFEEELREIYPSGYFLIDFVVAYYFNLELTVSTDNTVAIAPSLPIDTEEYKDFMRLNRRHQKLTKLGVDVSNTFMKLKAYVQSEEHNSGLADLYYNRSYRIALNHTLLSDFLLNSFNTEYYECIFIPSYNEWLYEILAIDVKSIIAQYMSLDIRPQNLRRAASYKDTNQCTDEIFIYDSGWVRIAHYEWEMLESDSSESIIKQTFGGIVFNESGSTPFPYSDYVLNMELIWGQNHVNFPIEENPIFSYISISNRLQLELFKLLWLNPCMINMLGIKMNDYKEGLTGINDKGENVIRLRTWQTEYVSTGYSSNPTEEIPKLDGSELIIRKDYFKQLCGLYNVEPAYNVFIL